MILNQLLLWLSLRFIRRIIRLAFAILFIAGVIVLFLQLRHGNWTIDQFVAEAQKGVSFLFVELKALALDIYANNKGALSSVFTGLIGLSIFSVFFD